MTTETPLTLLHLADLRFGAADASHRAAAALRRDAIAADRPDGMPPPDVIVVTGDVAATGQPAQYAEAAAWLTTLAEQLGVPSDRVFVVPGDGDVDPTPDRTGLAELVIESGRDGKPLDALLGKAGTRAALEARQQAYRSFAARFAPACADLWWHAGIDHAGHRVRLIGLDTALLADGDDRGALQLGRTQLVGDGGRSDAIGLLLSHHPFGGGWLRDEKAVDDWVFAHADVHLSALPAEVDGAATLRGHGAQLVRVAAGDLDDDGGVRLGHAFNHLHIIYRPGGAVTLRVWPRRFEGQSVTPRADVDGVPDGAAFGEYTLRGPSGAMVKPPPSDPLARYKAYLRRAHAHLVPFFQHGDDPALLDAVFVELELEAGAQKRRLTLRQLMQRRTTHGRHAGRWAVLGDPGSGKSTLARHLAWDLADEQAAVPIYLPLSRWAEQDGDPFDAAARELAANCERGQGEGLADTLREMAAEPGRVWLTLDGFDELHRDRVDEMKQRISTLAGEWPGVTLAVCSRRIGYQTLTGFTAASVQPLGPVGQRALLDKWLDPHTPGAGARAMARIAAEPALAEAAGNPLLLSLMAMLVRDHPHRALPSSRGGLYGQAVELLLGRGCSLTPKGIEPRDDARFILRALSLRLTEQGGDEWRFEDLDAHVEAVCAPGSLLARKLERGWTAPGLFLRAVSKQTGIIAPHNGPGQTWRYLHRSLRERLAAEALARGPEPEAAIAAKAQAIIDDEDALGQWGETLGVACALLDRPEGPLLRIRDADVKLALRMLPELRGLAPQTALAVLFGIDCQGGQSHRTGSDGKGWDGDDLVALFEAARWAAPASHLWPWVTPERSLDELAFLHAALTAAGEPPERAAFFEAAGRALPGPDFEVPMVDINPGSFMMGSPADEAERDSDEGPQRRVTLTKGFRLGAAPVTVAEYAAFDPSHGGEGGEHPVINVSWWRAYLFAAWARGRLPTEAEWEYACRADSTTRYWSGDAEADLARVGWYHANSGGQTHPVAEKDPNPWGLYDMHGNVREWVADWSGDYPSDPQADPLGPPRGVYRVDRGGSYWDAARSARSAYRCWGRPANRLPNLGFRLAAPPQLDLDLDG